MHRLDLTTAAARPPARRPRRFARSKPIVRRRPRGSCRRSSAGREYCTHSTVRDGRLQVYGCCESSAFQVNYAMVDKPEIEDVGRAGSSARWASPGSSRSTSSRPTTGGWSRIECNPRTHSAITMFYDDDPALARAYLDDRRPGDHSAAPRPGSRPTYWLYHELWRMLSRPSTIRERLAGDPRAAPTPSSTATDPLPFLLVHHLQIPSLLLRNLVRRPGPGSGSTSTSASSSSRRGTDVTSPAALRVLHLAGSAVSDVPRRPLADSTPAAASPRPPTRRATSPRRRVRVPGRALAVPDRPSTPTRSPPPRRATPAGGRWPGSAALALDVVRPADVLPARHDVLPGAVRRARRSRTSATRRRVMALGARQGAGARRWSPRPGVDVPAGRGRCAAGSARPSRRRRWSSRWTPTTRWA